MRHLRLILPVLCSLAVVVSAQGPRAVDHAPVTGLAAFPAALRLDGARDVERLVVVAMLADGSSLDVSGKVTVTPDGPDVATVGPDLLVTPHRDGKSELLIRFEDQETRVPIVVTAAAVRAGQSFHHDVIPVLTRSGCNAGGCHGSAQGKNGFRMSLFGYDPKGDHKRFTRELAGRRIDPIEPGRSLLLQKPAGEVAHKGGQKIKRDGPWWTTLRDWVQEGASIDDAAERPLVGLDVLPHKALLARPGLTQRIVMRAAYADETDRDVTTLAILTSSDSTVATVADDGVVTAKGPGEAFIMGRFGSYAVVAQILVRAPGTEDFKWPKDAEARGFVDRSIHQKLVEMRIAPASVCDDATFVRRVHLDLLNVLPSVERTSAFLADERADKRARLVDELLARPEFPDVWAMQWAELLRVESQTLRRKGMHAYTNWLRDAFFSDVPYDEMVRRLLTARGGTFTEPATNFYVIETDPKARAEMVSEVFLGVRVQCAQCHNHPFERWTMDDYYGFASFFTQVGTKAAEDPRERIVFDRQSGEIRNVATNAVARPRFLGGEEPFIEPGKDRRVALAEWLTADENPWFASNIANRVFARLFGRGVVDPVDDVRVSNPPSHPDLHEALGRRLVELRYDIRALIRELCASRTYQLAAREDDVKASALAGAPVRRLTAEQLLDAIGQVTGVPTKYAGLPLGARATQVGDGNPRSYFLDLFGRPRRTSSCACERRGEPTLGQALHLINGQTVSGKIADARGRLRRGLEAKKSDREILTELYLAAYSRPPTEIEFGRLLPEIEAGPRIPVLEDIYWAVLNSKEFVFNH